MYALEQIAVWQDGKISLVGPVGVVFLVAGGGIFAAVEDVFGGDAAGGGVDGDGFGFSETRGGVCEDPAWEECQLHGGGGGESKGLRTCYSIVDGIITSSAVRGVSCGWRLRLGGCHFW